MTSQLHGLREETLPALPAHVDVPQYDRSRLVPSVVHIGVGGFHRAHQALYFDDLAARGETGWGVVGVGLHRPQMGEVLQAQDGLFTVVERGVRGQSARVVGSVVYYLYAPSDPEAVVRALADARTRLVTLTVTGGGYLVDEDGCFQCDDPDVQDDLAHPEVPHSMVGFLVEALRRRRDSGTGPFTVLSCDNLPDSGAAARTAVVGFAGLRDRALARWIDEQCTFPTSMVDRITPETSPQARDQIEAELGVPDRWPVVTEPFRQWIVEDDFCAGRPPLEQVGVQFVQDVHPYKLVKARVLNGGHSALGYLGTLLGHRTTDQAMRNDDVRTVLDRMLAEEVLPLLPTPPGMDLGEYRRTTMERFANPAIGDSLARLCRRGSTKIPTYLLPSLQEAVQRRAPQRLLVLSVAAWMRYLRGSDLAGNPIELQDARAEALQALALRGQDDPRPLLGARSVFGSLGDHPDVVAELADALRVLSHDGLAAALARCEPVAARAAA
ncbi:MAG: Mannitol dehydrogenase domain protein [Frankiales bacterium]|nr:Mannitol dehydrogenase domain protein [Frankiales bacterium]